MTPRVVAVVPARYGSTRFPGKPLAPVRGVPLLQRVWALAASAPGVDEVLVATDDDRVAAAARAFGAEVRMTAAELPNGTTRALAAVEGREPAVTHVLNVQGDAVLTPPWVIAALAAALRADASAEIVTPAVRLGADAYARFLEAKKKSPASGTTVTFDASGRALYFSKSVIPFLRQPDSQPPVWRHVGLYGYRLDALRRYVALPPGTLERAEGLEQLRALERGMTVRVVPVEYRGRTHWSVDSPADLEEAERLIAAEGELLPSYDGRARWS